MGTFLGFVQLENTLELPHLFRNSSDVPTDATGTPAFRTYSPSGTMTLAGSASAQTTFAISGATNATPIVITSTASVTTGIRVTVASVGGNTAANGTFTATNLSSTTFSLDTSVGNGAYTSGGTWKVTGLYSFSIACTAANGFEAGKTYSVIVEGTVSGSVVADQYSFTCV